MDEFAEKLNRLLTVKGPPTKPMRYTATVIKTREITVEAETLERATVLFKRRLEPKEIITAVQTSLL